MKSKLTCAILFSGLALGPAALAQAQDAQYPDSTTQKILQASGVSYDDARAAAGGKNVVAYFDPELYAGEAYATHNDATCWVQWSEEGETLASAYSADEIRDMPLKYDRATVDRDMAKITLLHELSHCTQKTSDEYDADEKAIGWFLDHGGDRNSAKYWIYWRATGALLHNKKYGSGNGHFGVASNLHAKFFGGPAMSPEDSRKAIVRAIQAMQDYGGEGSDKPSWLVNGKKMSRALIEDMLADENLKLDADVRQILEISRDAYKFLAEGPTAQNPAARLSVAPAPCLTLAI